MANIADIIKYEGDNSTFIWKHPCEDFNTTTQLIVHESQEAIFFLLNDPPKMVHRSTQKHFCKWSLHSRFLPAGLRF